MTTGIVISSYRRNDRNVLRASFESQRLKASSVSEIVAINDTALATARA